MNLHEPKFKFISAEAKDFIKKALIKDKTRRPSAKQLLEHAWFKSIDKLSTELDQEQINTTLENLKKYSKNSKFQKSILSLMNGLMADKDEIKRVTAVFRQLDKDQNGQLSADELRQGKEILQEQQSWVNLDWEGILASCDFDGDGLLNF